MCVRSIFAPCRRPTIRIHACAISLMETGYVHNLRTPSSHITSSYSSSLPQKKFLFQTNRAYFPHCLYDWMYMRMPSYIINANKSPNTQTHTQCEILRKILRVPSWWGHAMWNGWRNGHKVNDAQRKAKYVHVHSTLMEMGYYTLWFFVSYFIAPVFCVCLYQLGRVCAHLVERILAKAESVSRVDALSDETMYARRWFDWFDCSARKCPCVKFI